MFINNNDLSDMEEDSTKKSLRSHMKFTEKSGHDEFWAQPLEGAVRRFPSTSLPNLTNHTAIQDWSAVFKFHPRDWTDTVKYLMFMLNYVVVSTQYTFVLNNFVFMIQNGRW